MAHIQRADPSTYSLKLKDEIASKVMDIILADMLKNHVNMGSQEYSDRLAEMSYRIADSMLAEHDKRNGTFTSMHFVFPTMEEAEAFSKEKFGPKLTPEPVSNWTRFLALLKRFIRRLTTVFAPRR